MKKRIFISISLSQEVSEKIAEAVLRLRWLPIRWIPQKNWHMTVISPFIADDGEIAVIRQNIVRSLEKFSSFVVDFNTIVLAPPGQSARMIWLTGPFSRQLQELKTALDNAFQKQFSGNRYGDETHRILPHIIVARFSEGEMRDIEARTRVLEDAQFSFEVREVCVMESRFTRTGVDYETLFCVSFEEIKK